MVQLEALHKETVIYQNFKNSSHFDNNFSATQQTISLLKKNSDLMVLQTF